MGYKMSAKRILILGGSGLLGSQLALRLRDQHRVYTTSYTKQVEIPGVHWLPLRIQNFQWAERLVFLVEPEVIIYAIPWNDPVLSRVEPKMSEVIHAGGVATILKNVGLTSTRFIYFSNGYVFPGTKGNYHESDMSLPCCMLGRHKLSGEGLVKSKAMVHNIIRLGPILGRGIGKNISFLERLQIHLERNEPIEVFDHEYHGFQDIQTVTKLVESVIELRPKNGTYHVSGLTKLTQFELACRFAERFGYNPGLIRKAEPHYLEHAIKDGEKLDLSMNSTVAYKELNLRPLVIEESFNLLEKLLFG